MRNNGHLKSNVCVTADKKESAKTENGSKVVVNYAKVVSRPLWKGIKKTINSIKLSNCASNNLKPYGMNSIPFSPNKPIFIC